jgi:uncharacterized membrane protein YqiK
MQPIHFLILIGAFSLIGLLIGFAFAMARFLKRPAPNEAIIRTGSDQTDVFIGKACWVIPFRHRATSISLGTMSLSIQRHGKDALVTQDFVLTNLDAQLYIRIEPTKEHILTAARTIEGDANLSLDAAKKHLEASIQK